MQTTANRNAAPKPETARRSKPRQLGLRISDVARKQLEQIADFHGFNLSHALEYAIRATARQDGIAPGGPMHRTPRQ